jgi:thiopeptide-type bacteriocin biosynthesis protein
LRNLSNRSKIVNLMKRKVSWLSVYFYHIPFDPFLRQAISPFVQDVQEQKIADQWFFIRYFDNGPHIRLRFRGEKEILETKLKPYLLGYFQKYFKEHPQLNPNWDPSWYAENTIRFVPYRRELSRYGGKRGILIAEEQFQASSHAVLTYLTQVQSFHYERALGIALQMHLAAIIGWGMNKDEAHNFFHHLFQTQDTTLFAQNFARQKDSIIPALNNLWNAFTKGEETKEVWYNNWLADMKTIRANLTEAYQKNQIELTPQIIHSHKPNPLWYIYESYVHMTNNRLGIDNRDEPFLAYILSQTFKAYGK